MSIWRIVEHQHKMYEYNATTSEERAEHLKRIIESTKPEPYASEWHELIASQFRYPVPVGLEHQARFRPAGFMKNVFYAAEEIRTSLYEHSYWFFKVRSGMRKLKKTGQRTLFAAKLSPQAEVTDLTNHPNVAKLTDPNDLSASHGYVRQNPSVSVLRYPSCRDPNRGANYAVLEIAALEKSIEGEKVISFSHDINASSIKWLEYDLTINQNDIPGLPKTTPPSSKKPRKRK